MDGWGNTRMTGSGGPVVLVVEDEPAVAESYEMMLDDEYDIRIAHGGEDALVVVDDADIVLLDRMMPGMSGEEVLQEIRGRGVDCRVVMVTAVDPDFDILEMGFDDYITKPPKEDDLKQTIEEVLSRNEYGERVEMYHELQSKRSSLLEEKSREELESNEEFKELEERIEELESELRGEDDDLMDDAEFVGRLRDLTEDDGSD